MKSGYEIFSEKELRRITLDALKQIGNNNSVYGDDKEDLIKRILESQEEELALWGGEEAKSPTPRRPGSSPKKDNRPTFYMLKHIYDESPFVVGVYSNNLGGFVHGVILDVEQSTSFANISGLYDKNIIDEIGGKWKKDIYPFYYPGLRSKEEVYGAIKRELEKRGNVVEMEFKDFKGPETEARSKDTEVPSSSGKEKSTSIRPTFYFINHIQGKDPIIGIYSSKHSDEALKVVQENNQRTGIKLDKLLSYQTLKFMNNESIVPFFYGGPGGKEGVYLPIKKELERKGKVIEIEFDDFLERREEFDVPEKEPTMPVKKTKEKPKLPSKKLGLYDSIIGLSGSQKIADEFIKTYLMGYNEKSAKKLVDHTVDGGSRIPGSANITNTQIFTLLEALVWSGGYEPKVIYTAASCSKGKEMDFWIKLYPLVEKYFSKLSAKDQVNVADCVIASLPKDAPLEWYKKYLGVASQTHLMVQKAISSNNFVMLDLIVQVAPEKIKILPISEATTPEMATRVVAISREYPKIKLDNFVHISNLTSPEMIDFFLQKDRGYYLDPRIALQGMNFEQLSTVLKYRKSFPPEEIISVERDFRKSVHESTFDPSTFELMIPYICQDNARASYWTEQLIKKELWPTLGILAAFKIEQTRVANLPDLSFQTTGHFVMPAQ
jgi:hypothetical protein